MNNKEIEKNENRSKAYSNFFELSTLGITLVVSTFLGLAIGLFLDKKLKTSPLFTIIFLILGIIAGFVNIFKIVSKMDKK